MIELTQEEIWLINSTGSTVQDAQQVLQRLVAAQSSLIQLLENKYRAVFDPATGQFKPKPKKEKK